MFVVVLMIAQLSLQCEFPISSAAFDQEFDEILPQQEACSTCKHITLISLSKIDIVVKLGVILSFGGGSKSW